jgi:hypothetical protein
MAPTNEQIAIAASIEKEMSAYPDTAGGMEQLLVNMYKYVPEFKRIYWIPQRQAISICSVSNTPTSIASRT